MKSNVIMESIDRELAGQIVPQRTCDGYFSLGAIMTIINRDRINRELGSIQFSHFANIENIKEFIFELEKDIGKPSYYRGTKSSRGWIHPFLALKFLTHYNPKFEIQVYKWFFDYLIDNRIRSADSYTRMCGVIAKHAPNKAKIQQCIIWTANKIKEIVGVEDWNKATEAELKRRDELQDMISDMMTTIGNCRIGFKYAIKADALKNGGKYADIEIDNSNKL